MATREIKPGQIISLLSVAQGFVSDVYGIKQAPGGAWPDQFEAQVSGDIGNTAFSVVIERALDQARSSWQVVATITTGAIAIGSILGGWLRVTVTTATGGPVHVFLIVG